MLCNKNIPKVSLVMACYNGVPYISEMFDSILAQKYDNIELILVNDGSTDETPVVISDYTDKFFARGYETIVFNQENQGVGAAVRNGLLRATGDFISFIDCDDTLDPEYVSALAGYLIEHDECEMVSSKINYTKSGTDLCQKLFSKDLFDALILDRIFTVVWLYMFRMSLLKRVKLAEKFNKNARATQEPDIIIPLIYYAREKGYIDRELYIHRLGTVGITTQRMSDKIKNIFYTSQRLSLFYHAIVAYGLPAKYMLYYNILCTINKWYIYREFESLFFFDMKTYSLALGFEDLSKNAKDFRSLAIDLINEILDTKGSIKKFLSIKEEERIIFYGVLGKSFNKNGERLYNLGIKADFYWDISATGDQIINGKPVTLPAFENLKPNDRMIIFPVNDDVIENVTKQAANYICEDNCFSIRQFCRIVNI
jgi:glycosyltransferase involved in cell wall biosynthesis